MKKKAIILFSGGLDSSVVMAIAQSQNYECYALTIDYHQRHRCEIDSARLLAKTLGAKEHRVVNMDIGQWGGSALTDKQIAVPTTSTADVPVTWVPARNTIFLATALGWAEAISAWDIFVGANVVDSPNYPDCRPEFYAAFTQLTKFATKPGVNGQQFQIHTPIISMNKLEIVEMAQKLKVDIAATHSCYDPVHYNQSCGQCDACRLRHHALQQAGIL